MNAVKIANIPSSKSHKTSFLLCFPLSGVTSHFPATLYILHLVTWPTCSQATQKLAGVHVTLVCVLPRTTPILWSPEVTAQLNWGANGGSDPACSLWLATLSKPHRPASTQEVKRTSEGCGPCMCDTALALLGTTLCPPHTHVGELSLNHSNDHCLPLAPDTLRVAGPSPLVQFSLQEAQEPL